MRRIDRRIIKNLVKAGAKFLDEKRPKWYRKISLTWLDMSDPTRHNPKQPACILCQLSKSYGGYQDFSRGCDEVGINYYDDAVRYGFDAPGAAIEGKDGYQDDERKARYFGILDEFWEKEIRLRRENNAK